MEPKELEQLQKLAIKAGIDPEQEAEALKSAVNDWLNAEPEPAQEPEPEPVQEVRKSAPAERPDYTRVMINAGAKRQVAFKALHEADPWRRDPRVSAEETYEAQKAMDEAFLVKKWFGDADDPSRGDRIAQAYLADCEALKAMDSTTSTSGDQWVPTGMSPALWRDVRLAMRVGSLFPQVEMATNPFVVPALTGAATPYIMGENTAVTAVSNPTTANMTFTAQDMKVEIDWSYELEEDAVFAVGPELRNEVVYALARGIDNMIINGDTGATHFDTGYTVGATDVRSHVLGLRKMGVTTGVIDLSTFSTANLGAAQALMGKYGINTQDLAWIVPPKVWNKMKGLDEVETVNTYGQGAAILTGQVGGIYGVPVIVSDLIGENLTAAGIYDGTTTTYTGGLLVNRQMFKLGVRRGVTIEKDKVIKTGTHYLVGTQRVDFEACIAPAAGTCESVEYIVKIS